MIASRKTIQESNVTCTCPSSALPFSKKIDSENFGICFWFKESASRAAAKLSPCLRPSDNVPGVQEYNVPTCSNYNRKAVKPWPRLMALISTVDQLNPSPCTAAGGGTCSTCRCLKKWPGGIAGVFWELQQAGALSLQKRYLMIAPGSVVPIPKKLHCFGPALLSHYKTKHPTKTTHKGPPELGHSSHRCTVWMAPPRLHWLGSMRLMDGLTSKTIALKCKFLLPSNLAGHLAFHTRKQKVQYHTLNHCTMRTYELVLSFWKVQCSLDIAI